MSGPETVIAPWYHTGLRFSCTQCGNCCSGAPGYVWLTIAEATQIAASLGLEPSEFTRRYTRRLGQRLSLLEKRDGDCVFLIRPQPGRTACQIHTVRPVQCRTWPFWKSNIKTEEAWNKAGQGCPGINQRQHHPLPVIQAALQTNGDLPL